MAKLMCLVLSSPQATSLQVRDKAVQAFAAWALQVLQTQDMTVHAKGSFHARGAFKALLSLSELRCFHVLAEAIACHIQQSTH